MRDAIYRLGDSTTIKVAVPEGVHSYVGSFFPVSDDVKFQYSLSIEFEAFDFQSLVLNDCVRSVASSYRNEDNLRKWVTPLGDVLIFPNHSDTPEYVICRTADDLVVYLRPSLSEVGILVVRILRELFIEIYLGQNSLVSHSAAFSLADCGFLVPGRKGAGKTTTLFSALRHSETKFVANDRVIVSGEKQQYFLRGVPMGARVSKGTLAGIPELTQFLHYFRSEKQKFIRKSKLFRDKKELDDQHKIYLTPKEISRFMDTNSVNVVGCNVLLFPSISSSCESVRVMNLSKTDALALLLPDFKDTPWPDRWLSSLKGAGPSKEEFSTALLDSVPAFRISYGYEHAGSDKLTKALRDIVYSLS